MQGGAQPAAPGGEQTKKLGGGRVRREHTKKCPTGKRGRPTNLAGSWGVFQLRREGTSVGRQETDWPSKSLWKQGKKETVQKGGKKKKPPGRLATLPIAGRKVTGGTSPNEEDPIKKIIGAKEGKGKMPGLQMRREENASKQKNSKKKQNIGAKNTPGGREKGSRGRRAL